MLNAGVFRNQLAIRLVIYSLLIGSVLSVFTTGLQLLISYRHQKDEAALVLEQINPALKQSLEFALWRLDFNQIDVMLNGLAANGIVSHLDLRSSTGERWERGVRSGSGLTGSFELVHTAPRSPEETVGTLTVEVSLDSVVARVLDQFWVTFQTNLLKAYFAAVALLFVAHTLITGHLRKIATHVAQTRVDAHPVELKLDRTPPSSPDDLDQIVSAIQTFDGNAREAVERLKNEVNERIKSEKEARDALSVRTSFIGAMSHEVRTPLNTIMGFLHLIEHSDEVPEKHRHYAHVASKASHQLHSQLSNVLEVSRLDSKAVLISTGPTDLRHLAEQWRDTAKATVHFYGKSITVKLDVDPALDDVYELDGARLTQVVTSLTDNAAKFTTSGMIRISVKRSPVVHQGQETHGIEICVADTGEGIDHVQRHFVFERFTQSDAGPSRTHGGSGLGLTIGRQICELMDAKLTLDATERDGFSTRFLITLGCSIRVEEHEHGS